MARAETDGSHSTPTPRLDLDSAEWLGSLRGAEAEQRTALSQLHDLLLRIACSEVHRRTRCSPSASA